MSSSAPQHPSRQRSALPFVLGAAFGTTAYALIDHLRRRAPSASADADNSSWNPSKASTPPPIHHLEGVSEGPGGLNLGRPGASAAGAPSGGDEESKDAISDWERPDDPNFVETLSDGSTYRINVLRGERFPAFGSERALRIEHALMLPDNCVVLDTFPKSGTTLTQRVVQILQGREEELVTSAVPWLLEAFGSKDLEEGKRDIACRTAFKSHSSWANVKKQPGLRYIYVARNGKDLAVSMFHHSRGFKGYTFDGSWDVFLEELFLTGRTESGCWFRHVREWWQAFRRWPEQILFLWYEDFLADPETYIRRVAKWIGVDASDNLIRRVEEKTSFNVMKDDPKANYAWTNSRRAEDQPGFLRKGVAGDWQNYFSPRQAELFDRRFEEEFAEEPELVEAFRVRGQGLQQQNDEGESHETSDQSSCQVTGVSTVVDEVTSDNLQT